MEDAASSVSPELVSLTFGAFVSQIVKDYEDEIEINKQIELLGYNIGVRLVEEYLAKTRTRSLKSFKHSCENIASVAFPMFVGITASVESWNEDEQSCILRFVSNPLSNFVELPEEFSKLQYNAVYCGIIRGALEMVHMKVDCSVIQDTLRGDDANAIRIRFVEYLEDSTQYMLSEEWDCLFHIFDFFGMDSIAKKEGAEPKAEGGNTIVIQVCDSEGGAVHFRVKSNTKMKKVFKNYSQKMGRDQSYFRFMYDGRSIGQDDTPESLGMEDNDRIDCELEQIGGN